MRRESSIKDMIKELQDIRECNKHNWDVSMVDFTITILRWVLGDIDNLKKRVL